MTCTCILGRASCAHACLVGQHFWSSGRRGTPMTSSGGFNLDGSAEGDMCGTHSEESGRDQSPNGPSMHSWLGLYVWGIA